MATIMCYITRKIAKTAVLIVMFIMVLVRVLPRVILNSLSVLELIKRRKLMFIFLNSIIITILISSSSFIFYIPNIFLKLNQKSKLWSTTTHHKGMTSSSSNDDDDGNWWFFTYMDYEQPIEEEENTSSFQILEEKEEKPIVEEEGDDLDATWKAIMGSKEKGSRPQLRKSDMWSCGDGGGKEKEKEKGGLSKYRVKGKLKKWQSFREMIEGKYNYIAGGGSGGCGGGGGGGEKPTGRKSMEVALTFHDEFKKRADAFIDRFTHEIRLQRLNSNQRFLEMINRGL